MTATPGRPRTEPSADLRQVASLYWQMYVALTTEGFTEAQALQILGHTIAAAMFTARGGDDT